MRYLQYMLRLISLVVLLACMSSFVLGFGISPPSLDIVHEGVEVIDYEIRLLAVDKPTDVEVIIIGEIAEFIEVEQTKLTIPVEGTTLKYTVTLPNDLAPGIHKSVIVIQEAAVTSEEGAGRGDFQLRSAIGHVVKVYGTSNQKYAEVSFDANNVNLGEKVIFNLKVKNLGGEDIESAFGKIRILNSGGDLIHELETNKDSYYSGMEGELNAHWTAGDLDPGKYVAILEFNYDGIVELSQTEFMIGSILIEPLSLSLENITRGGLLPIGVNVRNFWSEQIDTVYADLITSNTTARTSPQNIAPFSNAVLQTYIDTDKLDVGTNEVVVIVNYGSKTSSDTFDLFVVDEQKKYLIYYVSMFILMGLITAAWFIGRRHEN